MAKIMDYKTAKPKRANATYTWAWEVIIQEFDGDEYTDNIVARFFDPWNAVQHGINKYKGLCTVQAVLLHTDNLTDINGYK